MAKGMSLRELDDIVRHADPKRVSRVLKRVLRDIEQSPLPKGMFRIAKAALKRNADSVSWSACAILGRFVNQHPTELLKIIRNTAARASSEQKTAMATCILEHIMEHNLNEVSNFIRTERSPAIRFAMTDILSRCWPFGQAEKKQNWNRVERLIGEYPQLATNRCDLSFMLENGKTETKGKEDRAEKGGKGDKFN